MTIIHVEIVILDIMSYCKDLPVNKVIQQKPNSSAITHYTKKSLFSLSHSRGSTPYSTSALLNNPPSLSLYFQIPKPHNTGLLYELLPLKQLFPLTQLQVREVFLSTQKKDYISITSLTYLPLLLLKIFCNLNFQD